MILTFKFKYVGFGCFGEIWWISLRNHFGLQYIIFLFLVSCQILIAMVTDYLEIMMYCYFLISGFDILITFYLKLKWHKLIQTYVVFESIKLFIQNLLKSWFCFYIKDVLIALGYGNFWKKIHSNICVVIPLQSLISTRLLSFELTFLVFQLLGEIIILYFI